MNRLLLCISVLVAACGQLLADPELPQKAWEQHREGIAVAILAVTDAESIPPKYSISAFLKNTSSTDKYFAGFDGTHRDFEIFYTDDNGNQTPLRDYRQPDIIQKMLECPVIKPGATLSLTVGLTPPEIVLLKGRLVRCAFSMFGLGTHFGVESSPTILFPSP
jgi:hypothetical protein